MGSGHWKMAQVTHRPWLLSGQGWGCGDKSSSVYTPIMEEGRPFLPQPQGKLHTDGEGGGGEWLSPEKEETVSVGGLREGSRLRRAGLRPLRNDFKGKTCSRKHRIQRRKQNQGGGRLLFNYRLRAGCSRLGKCRVLGPGRGWMERNTSRESGRDQRRLGKEVIAKPQHGEPPAALMWGLSNFCFKCTIQSVSTCQALL